LAYFSWGEELFKLQKWSEWYTLCDRGTNLGGYVESSVWDVEVPNYEDKAGRHVYCACEAVSTSWNRENPNQKLVQVVSISAVICMCFESSMLSCRRLRRKLEMRA
jgi:hypothetical protein